MHSTFIHKYVYTNLCFVLFREKTAKLLSHLCVWDVATTLKHRSLGTDEATLVYQCTIIWALENCGLEAPCQAMSGWPAYNIILLDVYGEVSLDGSLRDEGIHHTSEGLSEHQPRKLISFLLIPLSGSTHNFDSCHISYWQSEFGCEFESCFARIQTESERTCT